MESRYKDYERDQQYFITLDAEEIRKNNPIVAAIDDYVENHVGIELFEGNTNNAEFGQKAENPKMMLKLLFYCFTQECYNSRDIEGRSRYDQNAIYLCGNRSVDHSTICRFLLKSKEQIYEIFTKMAYVLSSMGYVDKKLVAIDGTKIKANASMEFTGNKRDFQEKKKHIEKKIEKILNETEKITEKDLKKINKLERNKEKIGDFLEELKKDKIRKDEKVNITDPEARLMKDNGRVHIGYNCQTAVDGKNHIIIGSKVSNSANDRNLLIPMIEEIRKDPEEDKTKQKIVADAGFFSSKNVMYAEENNIDLYLPEGRGKGGVKIKRKAKGIISRDCTIHEEKCKKCLTCPGKYTSVAEKKMDNRGRNLYEFSVPASVCKKCKYLSNCNKSAGKSRRFIVMAEYYDSYVVRKIMSDKLASKRGKAIYHKRACIIEHVFGETKEYRNFRKFYHRGLDTVNTIWSIICIAYNFRKLAKLHYA